MAADERHQQVDTVLSDTTEKDGLLPSDSAESSSSSSLSSSHHRSHSAERSDATMMDEKDAFLDLERDEEGALKPKPKAPRTSVAFWIALNITSTVAIVFINKSIFRSPHFHSAQFFFAAYHLLLTYGLLTILSSPLPVLSAVHIFDRRSTSIRSILPLAASMSLSVVFLNTSLAFCSVPFYQTARVLLTPVVAAINFVFFSKSIPRQAAYMLVPICCGVAFMAYSDTKNGGTQGNSTSLFGAAFALLGVVISSVYTVWIGTFHEKLDMNSTQLLHAQSPVGAGLLFVLGAISGKFPDFGSFDSTMWQCVLLSGLCAMMINLSQFKVIGLAGSLAGTIVGQVKTIVIVIIGWIQLGQAVNSDSILGVSVAIAGVAGYMWCDHYYKSRG
ncbi:NADP-dependent alcohol dehydrogenase 7 [Sphaceloma murrayae]|uniref:GDP-mannose transporter n=1 Tax=Sphaceloma murrayae TaxID=2082308 RepID=A0A2K1R384_9PEZI|nr:NADP-dependent alcohol dehydrogenase 7 [Sphaceloma murrayae]